ncbi:MAG: phospholipase D-like domain-containing protein, partial [Gaiellales bacterium]
MSGAVTWSFLHPGGQSVAAVAGQIAEFIGSAEQEVAVAIYDFHVDAGGGGEVITHALQSAEERGVRVRLVDHDERKSDYKSCIPSPQKPPEYIDSLGLDVRPVVDPYGLMHHKYVVVDGRRLWMGSLNWTDDAFTLQENVFLTFEAPALAEAYRQNFDELWELRVVEGTGEFDHAAVPVQSSSERVRARPIFCPDRGPALAADIAAAMRRARRRILVCSPVLTSGPILGALTDVLERDGLSISGVVDGTMMRGVLRQWDELTPESWKPDAYRYIARRTGFSGRPST